VVLFVQVVIFMLVSPQTFDTSLAMLEGTMSTDRARQGPTIVESSRYQHNVTMAVHMQRHDGPPLHWLVTVEQSMLAVTFGHCYALES